MPTISPAWTFRFTRVERGQALVVVCAKMAGELEHDRAAARFGLRSARVADLVSPIIICAIVVGA